MKHINAPLPTRKDFGDIIPENVEALIMKCLAKDPQDRFETAGDFRDAIDVVIKDFRHKATTKPVEISDDKPTMMAKSAGDDKVTEAVEKAKVIPSQKANAGGNNMGMMVAAVIVILLALGFGAFQIFGAQNNDATEVAQESTEAGNNATDAPDEVAATDVPDEVVATDAPDSTNPEATASGDYPLSFGGAMPPHADNLNLYTGISPLMDEIDAMLLEGRWDDAVAYLDGILEADPTNFSALFARSQYYSLRYDDTQQDLADANALIETAPDSEWGYVALFDANNNHPDQNTDAARAAIEQAYEMAPTDPHVLWRRAAYSSYEVQTERYDEAEAAGARGYRYMAWRGDYLFNDLEFERAIPYQEMVYRYGIPGSYDRTDVSFWGLISSLILLDRSEDAFGVFMESGMMDEADDFRLYSDAAYLAFRAGEFEQARSWAATATALSGEAYAAQYVQALLMGYVDGEVDEAVALLTSLGETELYTRFINWEFQEDINLRSARILGEANRFEDALVYYNLVIEYYSYEAWLYEERADAYLVLGDVNAARSDLQTAVDIVQDSGYRRELLERLTALGPAPTSTPEPSQTPEPEATDE
jgi:tetratricopeptide (TPR) repeat protein